MNDIRGTYVSNGEVLCVKIPSNEVVVITVGTKVVVDDIAFTDSNGVYWTSFNILEQLDDKQTLSTQLYGSTLSSFSDSFVYVRMVEVNTHDGTVT